MIYRQKVAVLKDRAWLASVVFYNSCKTPWIWQQKFGQCVVVICPMIAWKAHSRLEKVRRNCLKCWEYARSGHTHLNNLLQAFCLELVKIVFYLNKRIRCMPILFTLKGEWDRRLYWIQMRQEALRFISGLWGIFSPNIRILPRKNNKPTPFILFFAMAVITNTSDRPNVSFVHF